ncbi:MAG: type I-F CRISPR-associated endoribonuclease Cas6/Csy4 [Campylobacterota bacterium]|nr:type I-F CRISPR-associated endoribonuclease Cas6/Csy4 [Campylobacterota bacterium]
MDYYIDIELFPKGELRENILLNQLYTEFHKRLYDLKSSDIGVSFPRYRKKLGDVFRIHGDQESLEQLQSQMWIVKYEKNYHISKIKPIPKSVKYRIVSRVQQNMSQSKLRRLIKRAEEGKGGFSQEDIKKYKIKMLQGGLGNPFVDLISGSNGKRHRRFIDFGDISNEPKEGSFDSFGLSREATIPWF